MKKLFEKKEYDFIFASKGLNHDETPQCSTESFNLGLITLSSASYQ